jgi:hypothetical protein
MRSTNLVQNPIDVPPAFLDVALDSAGKHEVGIAVLECSASETRCTKWLVLTTKTLRSYRLRISGEFKAMMPSLWTQLVDTPRPGRDPHNDHTRTIEVLLLRHALWR